MTTSENISWPEIGKFFLFVAVVFAVYPVAAAFLPAADTPKALAHIRETIVAECKGSPAIYLDLQGVDAKSRQVLAYQLEGQNIKSDWTDDEYIAPWMATKTDTLKLGDCLVEPQIMSTASGLPVGPFSVRKTNGRDLYITRVAAPNIVEHDRNNRWVWVQGEAKFTVFDLTTTPLTKNAHFTVFGDGPQTVSVKISYANKPDETASLSSTGNGPQNFTVPISSGATSISFTSDAPPKTLGDGRVASFQLRDLVAY